MLVLSSRSVKSRWVELEWASAAYADAERDELTGTLVPVLREDCEIPFLLRRLRHVDARGADPGDVALSLMSLVSHPREERAAELPKPSSVNLGRPLVFGDPQYVVRDEDSRVDTALQRGHAVLLFGARRVGKSSMLRQIASKETLRGRPVIWLDLQLYGAGSQSPLESVGYIIADALGCTWPSAGPPPAIRIRRLIKDCIAERQQNPVLLVDEFDLITHQNYHEFGDWLRSLLSDPATQGVSCVAAGVRPPWMSVSAPTLLSPWWDIFEPVRLGYFNRDQVAQFCTWIGEEARQHADTLWLATGGQPLLVAKAGYMHLIGRPLPDLLANPLDPSGPFAAFVELVASAILPDDDILRALRDGSSVSKEGRDALWLAGLVDDPRVNPPIIKGLLFRELILRLGEGSPGA